MVTIYAKYGLTSLYISYRFIRDGGSVIGPFPLSESSKYSQVYLILQMFCTLNHNCPFIFRYWYSHYN